MALKNKMKLRKAAKLLALVVLVAAIVAIPLLKRYDRLNVTYQELQSGVSRYEKALYYIKDSVLPALRGSDEAKRRAVFISDDAYEAFGSARIVGTDTDVVYYTNAFPIPGGGWGNSSVTTVLVVTLEDSNRGHLPNGQVALLVVLDETGSGEYRVSYPKVW